ncbi:MAG TPA: glycosyltransferase family 9 protein, partial [Orrella sp.]
LIMPDSFSSAALFAINGIASCGYQDDGRSLLLRHASRKPDHPVHAVQKWWLLTEFALKQWQVSSSFVQRTPPPPVLLEISDQERSMAKQVLQAQGLIDQPFILVAPTATGKHQGKVKVWPHFAALAAELKKQGRAVAMCPPPNEREQALAACPDALLLDPLPLKSFCALTQMAELVVCNDSGVSHLAAASGAQQLTLFGVTDPRHTGPWSEHAARLGQQGQWPSLEAALTQVKAMLGQPISPIEQPASAQSI